MNASKELVELLKDSKKKGTSPYDTTAEVVRVKDGIAWVHIPGGIDETPAQLTINAKSGDKVQVRVSGGSAFLIGNASSPPTDDGTAILAIESAQRAGEAASQAVIDANAAKIAAVSAQASADQAIEDARAAAESARDSAASAEAAHSMAESATQSANEAKAQAVEAKRNATEAQRLVSELESDVTQLDGRVATAEGKVTTIEGNITDINAQITTINNDIDNIEGDVSGLTTRVDAAEGKVITLEGEVSNLDTSVSSLSGRVTRAEGNIVAVEGDITTLQGRVSGAEQDIDQTLYALSVAEAVIDTINWVTEHGAMMLTTDTELTPNKVYFVVDPNGIYEVGGTHYAIVENPTASGLSTYYELTTDSAISNYIESHIALTSAGLVVTKDHTKWYVLVKNDGIDIVDNTSGLHKVVASYGTSIILGENNNSQSHAELDYHSFQLVDMDGEPYFHVSDFREKDGFAKITEKFTGNGRTKSFTVNFLVQYEISASDSSNPNNSATCDGRKYTFTNAPADGATVTIVYKTSGTNEAKAFTIGLRDPDANVGMHSVAAGFRVTASGRRSFAEGYASIASGTNSHAEGTASEAQGQNSHAEGYHTLARENSSHAQNTYTIAGSPHQTAMGKYNVPDYSLVHALIIGNGTADNARSNALTVAWNGDVVASGDVTDGNGNVLSDKIEMGDIPTDVSAFTNDAGYLTNFTETDPTVPTWAKASTKPSYSAGEISGLATVATSGSYNDLSNKPTIDTAMSSTSVNAVQNKVVKAYVDAIWSAIYPVGSYYETSDASFDPNTAWGGTWVLDSKGRVTVSRDETIADFNTVGKTGGEKTHTLTVDEMPNHTHKDGTSASIAYAGYAGANTAQVAFDANSGRATTATGGGQAHNNMPPYVVVNRWHRTA